MEKYIDCISVENMRESDRLTIERYVYREERLCTALRSECIVP